MARVTTVEHARKDQGSCGRCSDPIRKGDPYRHASPGFRSRKLVRCMKPGCAFRASDLTTSLMSGVYAAQEAAHDALDELVGGDFEDTSDLESILSTAADDARGVAEEYTAAADAMGAAGEEHQERADMIEAWADELEGVNFDDPPEPDEDDPQLEGAGGGEPGPGWFGADRKPEGGSDDEAMEDEWEAWREGAIDAAREAIDSFDG